MLTKLLLEDCEADAADDDLDEMCWIDRCDVDELEEDDDDDGDDEDGCFCCLFLRLNNFMLSLSLSLSLSFFTRVEFR